MERITSKQVISMMDAVAQVYEQPEVEQLDEVSGNPVMPSGVRDEARKRLRSQGKTDAEIDKIFADLDAAAQAKNNPTPEQRKAQVDRDRLIQQAGGGVAGEKAATDRLRDDPLRFLYDIEARGRADVRTKGREALRQLGDGDIELGLKRFREKQAAAGQTKPKSSVPAGSFNISPEGSDRRNEVEAQIKRDNAARTDDQRVQPRTAPKPQPTDQQRVRTEYDRLRNSKDPDERAQAVRYGRQMAAAGAAKKDFSGYQSAADAKKNLPAPAQRTSIAQRLQAIRDMRARSQSRIAAQGGKPATPAANPTPKAAPPPVPSTTSTSTSPVSKPVQAAKPVQTKPVQATKPVDPKNKKPQQVNNGDPMERMTGKGAQSLKETYNSVYEERTEEKVIDEGMSGALKKVIKIAAAAGGAAAAGKALEKATSSKEPTRDQRDAADAKKHLDHYRKTGKMMRNEEKTAADPGMKARMGKEEPKKGGYQLPKRTPANAKNVEYYKDDADLFDIIKGHFIEEGLTEEEALAKMLDLTDEERTEIIEGSCGSMKKKKKSKKGGY